MELMNDEFRNTDTWIKKAEMTGISGRKLEISEPSRSAFQVYETRSFNHPCCNSIFFSILGIHASWNRAVHNVWLERR